MFERLAARLRLPVPVVALLTVFTIDAVVASGIVGVVVASSSSASTSGQEKHWTQQELKDRFFLRPMDEVRAALGKPSHATVDQYGEIDHLRYENFPALIKGRPVARGLTVFGKGGRCDFIGFDTVDSDR